MNKDNKPRGKQEMIQDGSFKMEKKGILFFNINTIILVIIFNDSKKLENDFTNL